MQTATSGGPFEFLPVLLVPLFFAGMIVFTVLKVRSRLASARAVHAQALARGDWYTFAAPYRGGLIGDPFGIGSRWVGSNIIFHVRDGLVSTTFDYQWTVTTGSGKNRRSTTYHRKITGIWIGGGLPPLDVHGEADWTWSPGDFDTESIEFNDKYRVKSWDDAATLAILHPRMMEFLLASRDQIGGFAIGNGWLITAHADRDDLYAAHDEAYPYLRNALAGIPTWLASDYGLSPAVASGDWATALRIMQTLFPQMPSSPSGPPSIAGLSGIVTLLHLSR